MLVEGKKALITGSGRGIGRGIAQLLAEEGADVGINDLERNEAAEETLKLVGDTGRKASWHQADVSTADGINRMIDEFIDAHGRIDIMVNNAVSTHDKPFLEITEEAWDLELAIALKGYFLCSQRAAREMVKQGDGGRIVCISSVHALRAWDGDLIYGVCKAGLLRMVRSIALDLHGHNINANCILPGYIDSRLLPPEEEYKRGKIGHAEHAWPWIPCNRGGLPLDIAKAVLFLSSGLSDYVNGESITVDGGLLVGGTPETNQG